MAVSVPPPAASIASRLRDEATMMVNHMVFTKILGSGLLSRFARRLLLNAAGAQVKSGLGAGFALNGSPKNLRIGRGVYCNVDVDIEAVAPVTIGAHSAIGMQTLITTSNHPIGEDGIWSRSVLGLPVTIGERVWIGGRVTILPGTQIDDDVVVAAGSVARGHLKAGGLYAGVPARRIRDLRPTPTATKLV